MVRSTERKYTMKILLLAVPVKYQITGDSSDVIFNENLGFYPPLGLVYLYSSLKQTRPYDDIRIIDSMIEGFDEKAVVEHVLNFQPDIIGITVLTFLLVDVYTCVAAIKQMYPDVLIVLGGPHINLFPEEVLDNPNVDYVITGEGERSFPMFVDRIAQGIEPTSVPGIFYRSSKGAIKQGPPPVLIENLDELPLPDFSVIPVKKYLTVVDSGPSATLITSRGCPNRCIYCDRPQMSNVYRAHSPHRVFEEISRLCSSGIDTFQIFDDTFTINKKRVIEICQLVEKGNLDISFSARSRVNTVDEEVLSALKRAGCRRLSFGVEAASNHLLKALKKGTTIEQALHAFSLCKKIGIETLADFIIGGPDQTRADVEETIDFAVKLDPTYVQFTIMTPFPGTELYRTGMARGVITNDYWREFARNPAEDFETPVWEEHLKRDELLDLFSKAYKCFYHRPAFILRELFKVRSFGELYGKVRIGLNTFFT